MSKKRSVNNKFAIVVNGKEYNLIDYHIMTGGTVDDLIDIMSSKYFEEEIKNQIIKGDN